MLAANATATSDKATLAAKTQPALVRTIFCHLYALSKLCLYKGWTMAILRNLSNQNYPSRVTSFVMHETHVSDKPTPIIST